MVAAGDEQVDEPGAPVAQEPALLPGPAARTWARGLTPDGLARFDQWSREETSRRERLLYHELERQAFRRDEPGDPRFNWERVEEAIRELEASQRRAIEDEARQKARADVLEELRGAEPHRHDDERDAGDAAREERRGRRNRRRWRWFGSATLTTTSTTSATMLGAGTSAWLRLGVIALALGGAWLAGPGRE